MPNLEAELRRLLDDGVSRGELGPGGKLPTERALVERLGYPRGAIRRALNVLEAEGAIVRQVGRGTFLADRSTQLVRPTPPDTSPAQIMQARLIIEPPIAAVAAQSATQADLDRILDCLRAGGASTAQVDFEAWDTRLHRAIAAAGQNALLLTMFDVMNSARDLPVWGSIKRRTFSSERRACYHSEHTAVVDALTDRDPAGAEQAMRTHLRTVSTNLLGI